MPTFHTIGKSIVREWEERPLRLIIFLAILTRLLAVIFSKGFGWFDDQFLTVEAAQAWLDHSDNNTWLPWNERNHGPTGHNFFYPGIHYVLFKFLHLMGFTDPQGKMYIVRFLHAALSMVTVVLGYRLAFLSGGKKAASMAGLFLAILWFFPFISVRNLIEFTCVPFLMWGTWILMRKENPGDSFKIGILAGLVLGLAFSMRFQSLIYIGGIGLALLILGKWKTVISIGLGLFITAFLTLAIVDIFLWGFPFAELQEYINYNMHNAGEYTVGPWYQYILVILGMLVPPVSIFLVFGLGFDIFRNWRRNLLMTLPVIIFFVFHSYYPNKQERFILPAIPFIIVLGTIGWYAFLEQSRFWKKRKLLYRACWIFFWVINTILLLTISLTYSKRSRVESMTHLSKYGNIQAIIVENTNQYNVNLLPLFYLGSWADRVEVSKTQPLDRVEKRMLADPGQWPDFYIFEGDKNLDERVAAIRSLHPDIEFEASIDPSFIDKVLYWLNPVNENQIMYIYRNPHLHPEKQE